jgi:hypothetical protein
MCIKYILSVFYLRLLLHYRRYTYDIKMIPQCNRMLNYNMFPSFSLTPPHGKGKGKVVPVLN